VDQMARVALSGETFKRNLVWEHLSEPQSPLE
jgi:hypothetical protein